MNRPLNMDVTSSVGFLVGIGAWSISFITLIWGYVFFRLRLGPWLGGYIDEAVLTGAFINTGILICSSWMLHQFLRKKRNILFGLALVLGALFVKKQWGLWMLLLQRGLTLKGSIAGGFLYLLTGFHAAHVVIGLMVLLFLGTRVSLAEEGGSSERRFTFALRFWDLLLLFWLVLLVLIFILK
ncbi:MAG: cytochrome c oxidase subunit 3 [Candidatus Omnitrophica bacterium]|nr:cytochrome c oxidase subunit 3 [Candidatus Omnitrophota bacterium]